MAIASPVTIPGALSLRQYATAAAIPPGGNELFRNTAGSRIYIVEASHDKFELLLNDKVRVKGRLARGYRFPVGQSVKKVQVFNLHPSSALSLRFEVGDMDPIDNGLNVYTEQITPIVRQENPSSFAVVSIACTGIANSLQLLPTDCDRAHALLFTSAAGEAYYGPDATTTWPAVDGNRVGQTLDNSATRYASCAPLFVRGPVGTTVYAYVFSY